MTPFKMLKQEDYGDFEVTLGDIVSSRLVKV